MIRDGIIWNKVVIRDGIIWNKDLSLAKEQKKKKKMLWEKFGKNSRIIHKIWEKFANYSGLIMSKSTQPNNSAFSSASPKKQIIRIYVTVVLINQII